MSSQSTVRGGPDQPFSLIETLRYKPGEGCIRAERHLQRMAQSSTHFNKSFNIDYARTLLDAVDSSSDLRLRLVLDHENSLTLTTHPFTPIAAGSMWHVAVATTVFLENDNPNLAHKTSLRHHYDAARSEYPPNEIDEVILLNQLGHVCEGTITSVFLERDGMILTPPLEDGLLRGVLRQELLDTGRAIEATLMPQDLNTGKLFVGNSLRGLIPAQLKS